jgi:hypothetical protein
MVAILYSARLLLPEAVVAVLPMTIMRQVEDRVAEPVVWEHAAQEIPHQPAPRREIMAVEETPLYKIGPEAVVVVQPVLVQIKAQEIVEMVEGEEQVQHLLSLVHQ